MDRVLAAPDEARRVLDDGRRRDLDLRRKEMVSGAQAAGSKDVSWRERTSFSPDEHHPDNDDGDDGKCRDDPGRLEVELIHEDVAVPREMLS